MIRKIGKANLFLFKNLLLHPAGAILRLPYFWYQYVFKRFLSVPDSFNNPVINYSADINTSGGFYWLRNAAGIKRSGVLGFDFMTYCGVPTGLYDFPLAGVLLNKLPYKYYFLTALGIMLAGMAWLLAPVTEPWIAAIVMVAIFSSNLIWEQLSFGLYEIMAWAVFILLMAILINGQMIIGGLLLGAIALFHPTIFFVCFLFTNTFLLISGADLLMQLYFNLAIVPVAGWWVLVFIANRKYLCRAEFLNYENNGQKGAFGFDNLWTFLLYLLFCASFLLSPLYPYHLLLLIVAGFAVLNFFVWIFSPYTLRMAMLSSAVVLLALDFSIVSLLALLPFLFIDPRRLAGFLGSERYLIGIRPYHADELMKRIRDLFNMLTPDDAVCFEYIGKTWKGIYFVAFLSYVLRHAPFRLFNIGFSEIYNRNLFVAFTQKLNAADFTKELADRLSSIGINYIVAFSPAFRDKLITLGYVISGDCDLRDDAMHRDYADTGYTPQQLYVMKYSKPVVRCYKVNAISGRKLEAEINMPGEIELPVQFFPGLVTKFNEVSVDYDVNKDNFITVPVSAPGKLRVTYSRARMFSTSLKNFFRL